MSDLTVFQFPGQGAYDPDALVAARDVLRGHASVFERIDAVVAGTDPAAGRVSATVFAQRPPALEALRQDHPDLLQLSIYAVSVAVFEILRSRGVHADAMLGHSFGEIAALVCAGAFTVEQGAELVCRRNMVLREQASQRGVMAAVGAEVERVQSVVDLVGRDDVVVAVDNAPAQTVVSGTDEGVAAVGRVAEAVGAPFVPLAAPYAFHSPVLSALVAPLAERLRGVSQGTLQTRVYSPLLGRWFDDGDVLTDELAAALDRPVRYREAVLALRDHRAATFVECGAKGALSSLVRQTAPEARTVVCLSGRDAETFPESQVAALGGAREQAVDPAVVLSLLPDVEDVHAHEFWRDRGESIVAAVRAQFAAHREEHGAAATPAPAAAEELAATPADGIAAVPRGELYAELRSFYAEALEYPEEVFSEDVELEADLGVDSVKQTELLARVADRYGLPEPPADFRLADYRTMGHVVDFVAEARGTGGAEARDTAGPEARDMAGAAATPTEIRVDETGPDQPGLDGSGGGSRDELYAELRAFYAEALEYPEEVFSEEVELEADLGVDSVKQTELLARVADRYGLPEPPADFRLADYRTMGRVVDFVAGASRVMARAA